MNNLKLKQYMNRVNLNILSKLNVFNSSFELNQAKYLVYFCSHAGFGWVKIQWTQKKPTNPTKKS